LPVARLKPISVNNGLLIFYHVHQLEQTEKVPFFFRLRKAVGQAEARPEIADLQGICN